MKPFGRLNLKYFECFKFVDQEVIQPIFFISFQGVTTVWSKLLVESGRNWPASHSRFIMHCWRVCRGQSESRDRSSWSAWPKHHQQGRYGENDCCWVMNCGNSGIKAKWDGQKIYSGIVLEQDSKTIFVLNQCGSSLFHAMLLWTSGLVQYIATHFAFRSRQPLLHSGTALVLIFLEERSIHMMMTTNHACWQTTRPYMTLVYRTGGSFWRPITLLQPQKCYLLHATLLLSCFHRLHLPEPFKSFPTRGSKTTRLLGDGQNGITKPWCIRWFTVHLSCT